MPWTKTPAADAAIRGALKTLVDLLEGRLDGDALFFSRELAIEGDTEAVVALRNAVDDAEIDLAEDVLSVLGPASRPAGWALSGAQAIFTRAERDLNALGDALNAPGAAAHRGAGSRNRRIAGRTGDPQTRRTARVSKSMELVCPAGTPASLRAAVDAGGDAVYLGFRDETNARNFPGLNFSRDELRDGIAYAHDRGAKILVAVNTYPEAGNPGPWRNAVNDAARLGADAVIVADIGLADYVARTHPDLRLHLSVQASASSPEAIRFYQTEFGVRRVVLPRVLSVPQIAALTAAVPCETEVFAFGGLCVMAEGRCCFSSYATPCSPNRQGVCSPASHVRYVSRGGDTVTKLGDFTVNAVAGETPPVIRPPARDAIPSTGGKPIRSRSRRR